MAGPFCPMPMREGFDMLLAWRIRLFGGDTTREPLAKAEVTPGGTVITLYGKGFHEFEGKRTPQFARCRFTDGRHTDDTTAIFLSSVPSIYSLS